MKRLRHLVFTAQPRGGEHMREDDQQAIAIYDAIAQAVRDCDPLRRVKYNDFPYETDVLWLLQHLPATSHRNDVAELLKERFTKQQDSHQFDSEDALRLQTLAEDIWHAWSQYLQRHEPSALTQQTHTRSRMRRFYYPAHR